MSNRTLMDCAQAALMHSEEDARIIADAAEEIERLRARVEVLEKALGHYANDYRIGHCARIALLEAKP